ncbi:adenosine deaminase [Hyphomonas adhaerens MHS-3]|uniref:Adenine deaminase n=1 Tax=Hyphomonas adhaerens MHS-3 TaxID=1280949 RepID=A0A069E1Z2_9PROT|nr:adenosine deaminase [Hyphomonas adhaerens]KCZ83578.1 adenosine deaminase [Hyphomonas adhaerens MHS-3]
MATNHAELIARLPKAELHLHIEGSFEPEMMMELAERNRIEIPFKTLEEAKAAYDFANLQEFLDLYYQGMNVLRTEQDFHDLTWAYLLRAKADNVRHVEMFYDPQAHTERGVAFGTVTEGILSALERGQQELGITSELIMSFLRHLSEDDGFALLDESKPWHDKFVGVGLDSSEVGHPPLKFERLFAKCRELGFKLCLHAGEEGPPAYVREALLDIGADRIDHGNRAMEDSALIEILRDSQTPLTNCPLSNLALCVIDDLRDSPLKAQLEAGLLVTVNSDDPAYFGGYIGKNYEAIQKALDLTDEQLVQLARNSFTASFLPDDEKARLIREVDSVRY